MHRYQRQRAPLQLLVASFILMGMGSGSPFGQKLRVEDYAPDFTVPLLDGKRTVRLSDFRGRRVLIFTWASW